MKIATKFKEIVKIIKTKQLVKKLRWSHWLVLLPVCLAFFLGASYFNHKTQTDEYVKWSSPDETANYTFAKLYAQEGRLEIMERYNLLVQDIMRPRSFRVHEGMLRPMSFLGLVLLYGKIGSIFGAKVLPYLTPFFGAIGIFFFYLLMKELFYKRMAIIAAVLLAVFPVYGYFSAKSMFHNILFLVMLIIGFYFTVAAVKMNKLQDQIKRVSKLQVVYFILGGLALGWAIATRTSELIWLVPVFVILFIGNAKKFHVWQFFLLVAMMILALLPIGYYNLLLYGGVLNTGYAEVNTSINNLAADGQSIGWKLAHGEFKAVGSDIKNFASTVFYFGFRPLYSLKLFLNYTMKLFPWLPVGFMFGVIFWLLDYKKIKRGQVMLLGSMVVLAAILIVYYGSWDFHDNPDPSAVTIGNSYTRYWLPIYAIMIAWLAYAIDAIARNLGSRKYSWIIVVILTLWIGNTAVRTTWAGSDEAIRALIVKSQLTRNQWDLILSKTERNSVIITKYQDKLFFPERKVIYGLFDDVGMIREYAKIAKKLPTYFYNFTFTPADLKYLNERRLPALGLQLKPVLTIYDFTLYKLINK